MGSFLIKAIAGSVLCVTAESLFVDAVMLSPNAANGSWVVQRELANCRVSNV